MAKNVDGDGEQKSVEEDREYIVADAVVVVVGDDNRAAQQVPRDRGWTGDSRGEQSLEPGELQGRARRGSPWAPIWASCASSAWKRWSWIFHGGDDYAASVLFPS